MITVGDILRVYEGYITWVIIIEDGEEIINTDDFDYYGDLSEKKVDSFKIEKDDYGSTFIFYV